RALPRPRAHMRRRRSLRPHRKWNYEDLSHSPSPPRDSRNAGPTIDAYPFRHPTTTSRHLVFHAFGHSSPSALFSTWPRCCSVAPQPGRLPFHGGFRVA
ncbi:MAG: hypothetical protein ACO37D_11530, partial [Rhodothermales bacterium]